MRRSASVGLSLSGAVVFTFIAGAQVPRRSAPRTAPDDKVNVVIALHVGGDAYHFTGGAICTHEVQGEIFTVRAQQWRVEQADERRRVALTFWRPASGSNDMFMLYLQAGGRTHAASTVRTPGDGQSKGAGEVTFAREGAGGTFTLNATAANGTTIRGTIACAAFRSLRPEGGN